MNASSATKRAVAGWSRWVVISALIAGVVLVLGVPAAAGGPPHEEHERLGRFVEPAGIVTLALLILTAAASRFIRRKRKPMLTIHKLLGVLSLVSALSHAGLVMLAD